MVSSSLQKRTLFSFDYFLWINFNALYLPGLIPLNNIQLLLPYYSQFQFFNASYP